MSTLTRQKSILSLILRGGDKSVAELAEALQVSTMTVRRDLTALAAGGRVIRTHGGAAPAGNVMFQFRFLERMHEHETEKAAIAAKAATLVSDGMSILLDSGTTTLALARALHAHKRLTVITTSLPIASELQYSETVDLILLGGRLRRDAPDLGGALTLQNLQNLSADIAFIGADAISPDGGIYNNSMEVAAMLAVMLHQARSVYILADSSKIGGQALSRFGNLRDTAGLITDGQCPDKLKARLTRLGITWI